ncbi:MAG: dockerin type I repeat-containing protein [Clostridia bacterium]|nr:dockerin type I repeat-containing protein [Clostridia bacterium]
MIKKLFSAALALLMLFDMFSLSISATESDNHASWSLSCSGTKPKPGDVFEIDVFLSADYVTNCFGASIVYDRNYYEPAEDEEADNFVIADDLAPLGNKSVIMSEERSSSVADRLYGATYTEEMRKQYAVAWFSFFFRNVFFDDPMNDVLPSFASPVKVATLKLRYRSDAPDDGKGLIWMDPAHLQTANDTSKHTFVARSSSNVVGECVVEKRFGQSIDLSGAVEYFGVPKLSAARGSDAVVDAQSGLICSFSCASSAADVLALVEADDGATLAAAPTANGYGTGTTVSALIKTKAFASYTLALYGDLTGDGYVDSFDVALAGEYVNTFTSPEDDAYFAAADVYPDGYLDAIDMAYILNFANFE